MFTRSRPQADSVYTAVALLVSAAVGAGIFGLPYVIYQSGILIGLIYLIGLGIIGWLVNLAYGDIVLSTPGTHQLPFYAEKYLGKRWKIISLATMVIGFYGALAAYVVEVSVLLQRLLDPWWQLERIYYVWLFFIVMGIALYIGLRAVAQADRVMILVNFILIAFFVTIGLQYMHWEVIVRSEVHNVFLPYGVVLFALSSAAAIPDMSNIVQRNRKLLRRAITIGSFLPVVIYIAFVIVTIGLTGAHTTENALIGLGQTLGHQAMVLGSIFGVISMTTSFLLLGLVLKETYSYDFKVTPILAWLGVLVPPLIIVLSQWFSFIQMLGISGAILGGVNGIILIKIHASLPNQLRRAYWHYLVYTVFMLGIIYEGYTLCSLIIKNTAA